jgi:glycosyltransferase involved in cell wall biosynthesis
MGLTNPALLGVYLTRAKIIFTEHASGFPFRRGALKNLASRMIHTPLRMRISRYVGVSKYVVNRLKLTHHVSEQQATTIYNGVNIARFVGRDRATTRATLGIPINAKVVCAVAMLIPEKGIQHLFDATALLVEQYGQTDIRLLVVGEGAYRRELEQQVIRTNISPYVMFLGRRSDVHDIVAASDVIAVPCTWEESFGLIIAEAMAGSRPVVASRTGGIPELVDHGLTGLLVTPGKSRELAASLHRLLTDSDEYRRMGEAGIEKARVMFDLEKQVVKLADLYDEIVEA